MEKLKKQLEDIKGALPLMIKLRAIDQRKTKVEQRIVRRGSVNALLAVRCGKLNANDKKN